MILGAGTNYQWTTTRKNLPSDLGLVSELGVRCIREDLLWQIVQPSKGTWNWGSYDQLFASAATHHVEVLPILGYGTGWATGPAFKTLPKTATARAAFMDYVRAAVKRYGAGGSFWAANPRLTPRPPTAWDIWNEPWHPGPTDPVDYVTLVRMASDAIRLVDPGAKVVINVDDRIRKFPDGRIANWSTAVFDAAAVENAANLGYHVDVWSIHPYTRGERPHYLSPTNDTLEQVMFLRSQLASRRLPGDVWVTELGYTDAPTQRDPDNNQTTAARDMFAATAGLAGMSDGPNPVTRCYAFTLARPTVASEVAGAWDYGYNLFAGDGKPKRALLAFATG